MSDAITVYGPRPEGGRNLGLTLDGVRVLLTPRGAEGQAAAEGIAQRLLDADGERAAEELRRVALESEVASLRASLERARSRAGDAESRAHAAITGRRRFSGPVLMQPAQTGDWTGAVWLLDPEKKGRGFGLRFANLAEVRELHPELWVVGVTEEGVLLDAWGARERKEGP